MTQSPRRRVDLLSLARRFIGQVREIWAEFDYAQRRMLEIRLGRRFLPPAREPIATSIDELEALFAYEPE